MNGNKPNNELLTWGKGRNRESKHPYFNSTVAYLKAHKGWYFS